MFGKSKTLILTVALSVLLTSCTIGHDTFSNLSVSPREDSIPAVQSARERNRSILIGWYESDFRPGDEKAMNFENAWFESREICRDWGFQSVRFEGESSAACERKQFNVFHQCDMRLVLQCAYGGGTSEPPAIAIESLDFETDASVYGTVVGVVVVVLIAGYLTGSILTVFGG